MQEELYEAAQQAAALKARRVDKYAQDERKGKEGDGEEFAGEIADPWAELHESPGAQAMLDPDRFFNQYFLTDLKPNRRKTTRGLRLDGLAGNADAIIRRAERYGLYKWMTKEKPIRVCLGWDLRRVQNMAEFTDEKIRERRTQTRTREETRLKKVHDDLVAQYQEGRDKNTKSEGSQEWDIAGHYMIMANELLDHCSPEGPFTLSISDKVKQSDVGPGRRAGYDFTITSGSMLLATSSAIMDWLLADAERDHQAGLAENDASGVSRKKRKEPPTQAQLHHRQKRDLQAPRAYRKKSLNYEIRLRGQEVVGDETQIFHQPRSGHIRFKDDTFMTFIGKINMGESLGLIDVQGFKYSLEAPRKTPKWNDYTEIAVLLEQEARELASRPAEEAAAKQSKKTKRTSISDNFTTPRRSPKLPRSSSKKKKD